MPPIVAMMALLIIPAAETQKLATRLLRHRNGLTGVGFAQPINGAPVKNAIAGNRRVPMGSTCAAGFRLMRPCNRARSSPNLFDIHACADSWTDNEKINATMNRMNCPTALLSMSPISNQLSEGIARVAHTNMALETCQKTPKSSIGSVPSPACFRSEGPVVSSPVR